MIISIINQKGGVGKTTLTQTLGAYLTSKKKKVLYVDLDPQGNLTYTLEGLRVCEMSSYEVLSEPKKLSKVGEEYDYIPSSQELAAADITISSIGKEYKLKEELEPLLKRYDYILIDTPPALGILTINALTASHKALIPAATEIFSLQGITQLAETIEGVKSYTNKELEILGIAIIKSNQRTVLNKELTKTLEGLSQQLNTKVYSAQVRDATAVKEAQVMQTNIFDYQTQSAVVEDFKALCDEIYNDIKA